jgi:hypothetical protein
MYLLNRNHTTLHVNFRSHTQLDKRKIKIAHKSLAIVQMEFTQLRTKKRLEEISSIFREEYKIN